jgi:hypothetical protein
MYLSLGNKTDQCPALQQVVPSKTMETFLWVGRVDFESDDETRFEL